MKKPSEKSAQKSSDQEDTHWYEGREPHFQGKPWMDRDFCRLCPSPADFGLEQGQHALCAPCAHKEGLL